ncbi:MAG TPA: RidA family protein [Reyranellaceae bacterium]|nr:RidA family protein [Reyranellaceae bacterium]
MSNIAYTPVLPQGWNRPRGFSHGVIATGTKSIRIAGQIGRAPDQAHIPPGTDAGTQWKIALANVAAVLKAAGGEPGNLVALRAYVTDIKEFNEAGPAIAAGWGAALGKHFPAMTLVQVSGLIDPNAKVEIEGEAILP